MKIYIKQNNVIQEIDAPEEWLNEMPAGVDEYSWLYDYFIKTLNVFIRNEFSSSSLEEFNNQELEYEKKRKIGQCKIYLNKTDWQALANISRQRPYDENVEQNRLNAVNLQAEISSCNTLEEINNLTTLAEIEAYNETFE